MRGVGGEGSVVQIYVYKQVQASVNIFVLFANTCEWSFQELPSGAALLGNGPRKHIQGDEAILYLFTGLYRYQMISTLIPQRDLYHSNPSEGQEDMLQTKKKLPKG